MLPRSQYKSIHNLNIRIIISCYIKIYFTVKPTYHWRWWKARWSPRQWHRSSLEPLKHWWTVGRKLWAHHHPWRGRSLSRVPSPPQLPWWCQLSLPLVWPQPPVLRGDLTERKRDHLSPALYNCQSSNHFLRPGRQDICHQFLFIVTGNPFL